MVTGASGFLGGHVIKYLKEKNFDIHVIHRNSICYPDYIKVHPANLLEPGEAKRVMEIVRPTHLLHLAWDVSPGQFWRANNNLDWVAASLLLYRAFVEAGGRRAVFAGTCAEYDWRSSWLDETTTPRVPQTLYGVAKNALFELIASANEPKTSFAWARLFFLYGPHEPLGRLIPDVINSLLREKEVACSEGWQERDFLHVDDAARAFAAILTSNHCGPINIASGDCRSVREILERIGALAGREDLIRFGARPLPENEPARLAANISLLRGLGFTPRYTLEHGLAETWSWWKSKISEGP